MTDLRTSIDGFKFDNVFMNASGVRCYTEQELDELVQSDAGTLVTKSATQAKRLGNPSPRYARLELARSIPWAYLTKAWITTSTTP